MAEDMTTDVAGLAKSEFGFPGALRDKLVAAILSGAKTSTTGLLAAYEAEDEALPEVSARSAVVDSADRPVAVIEITEVRVVPFGEVDLAHAVDESEGDTSLGTWRAAHERFFTSAPMREVLGDPEFAMTDATPVVLERFRLVARLD
jgi:uncharacterized protein YhfF